ncbi:hypothetical protein FN846DRAFT_903532 [Sphaerosporella brunnea]|uniref:F-box domain-containing protein n=1 Tax=Sphaerosporella brunnea TaxID=1250544 RepID=A0A5J5F7E0_9PEZI|nr:hypothetical protein FN846DRAFT_903532 [Sphaerosporella brunnea]
MPPTTATTTPLSTLPVEILLSIIAAVMHGEDDDIGTAIRTHVRRFRHASAAVYRVWRAHKTALMSRVALERLALLKIRARLIRRRQVRARLRHCVWLASMRLRRNIDDRFDWFAVVQVLANSAASLADCAAAVIRIRIFHLKCFLSPGYMPCELDWTDPWKRNDL